MNRRRLIKAFFWVTLLVGAVFAALRLGSGLRLTNLGSYVTWGLQVAAYTYFIGLSAGAFLFSSLVYVFGMKSLKPLGPLTLILALVSLIAALVSIGFDLGHIELFWKVYVNPNLTSLSVEAWVFWLYTIYFFLLLAELYFAVRGDLAGWSPRNPLMRFLISSIRRSSSSHERDAKILRILGSVGVPLAIAFHGGVGALFGVVVAKPYWYESIYPIMFLTGALFSGSALLLFVTAALLPRDTGIDKDAIVRHLSAYVLGFLLLEMLLLWSEITISIYPGLPYGAISSYHSRYFQYLLFGQGWWTFWIIQVLLGMIVPVAIIIWGRKSTPLLGFAGFLAAAAFLAMRYNIVVPGGIMPELEGLSMAYQDHRLLYSYSPSVLEWGLLVFAVGLAGVLFFLLYDNLPVFPKTKEAYHA